MLRRFMRGALAAAFLVGSLAPAFAAVQASVIGQITGIITGTAEFGAAQYTPNLKSKTDFINGTATGQADKFWSDTRTLAASATEDLDLAGTLKNALGQTSAFGHVKAIMITADAGNTNNVVVGNAGSNGFVGPFGAAGHTVKVVPGAVFLITSPGAGFTVTADTGDLLHIANSAGTTGVTYSIIIIGTST